MKEATTGVVDKYTAKQSNRLRETCLQSYAIAIAFAMALAPLSVQAQNTDGQARDDAASATVERLKRATQELLDAIAPGDGAVWQRHLAEDCIYTDEEGNVKTKRRKGVREGRRRPGSQNARPPRKQ